MQAMLVDSVRPRDRIYEIKFDGYRAWRCAADAEIGQGASGVLFSIRSRWVSPL
jgi:hypothetical protein